MILPLTHERMTVQRLPWVTIGIIASNLVVFLATWPVAQRDYARSNDVLVELDAYVREYPRVLAEDCRCPEKARFDELLAVYESVHAEHIFSRFGYVPARPRLAGLLGSLFLHAGWMHLIGNMYLLWLCGCSIEDLWGRPLYAFVYVSGGAGAALAHGAFQPESVAHLVGASGAIAALMGVFFIRCWDTQIRFFYWFFVTFMGTFLAPAWIMLILWLTRELFYAFVFGGSSSVAFWAHIGGFGFGTAFALLVKATRLEERLIAPALERKTNLVAKHPGVAAAVELMDASDHVAALGQLKAALAADRDDPDVHRLLAQCYLALHRPEEASRWLRRELAIHGRRREHELASETYFELRATWPDAELTPRELWTAATAIAATGEPNEARSIYERLVEEAAEPVLRIRAGLALAELEYESGRARRAIELLDRAAPLAETQLEWLDRIEAKRREYRASIPAPVR